MEPSIPDIGNTNSFVEFYDSIEHVPVSQHDFGTQLQVTKRVRLYSGLGIPSLAFRNSSILEIGPGGGQNAQALLGMKPRKLSLFDGSRTAVNNLELLFLPSENNIVEIIHGDMNIDLPEETFDFVIAEGCIPGQKNPEGSILTISQRVGTNGILVFTTQTATSLLAEILRRIIAKRIIELSNGDQELYIKSLIEFFTPSFLALPGMTRSPRDWVLDVLVHPWEKGNHIFTILDAYKQLEKNFTIIGTRPEISLDTSWYKTDVKTAWGKSQTILDQYEVASVTFLDYRKQSNSENPYQYSLFSLSEIKDIETYCGEIYSLHNSIQENHWNDLPTLHSLIQSIDKIISVKFPKTHLSITDYLQALPELIENPNKDMLSDFHSWFGRGQQYVSVMRI
jgi:hypothetical protein